MTDIKASTRLQLALSALVGRCELIIAEGQLSRDEERKLNELIQHIKNILKQDKAC